MMKNIRVLPTGRKQFFRRLILINLGIFSCGILSMGESYGQATQSYDVPRVISYQGVVHDNNGSLLSDGNYQITASFYDDALGTSKIWQGKYTVTVSQGTFNVMLGSGDSPLPALKAINKPIWVGIQVGESQEMRPLTQFASSPYTLNIPDNSVTKEKMGTDYIGKISINGQEIKGKGAEINITTGNGILMDFNPATNDLLLQGAAPGNITPQFVAGPCPGCVDGNVTTNFIGNGNYNTATGGGGIGFGFVTVSGGYNNNATADYSTIAGGAGNTASGCGSFVGGGGILACPTVGANVPPAPATAFSGNSAIGLSSAILGGTNNVANSDFTAIGGGQRNTTKAQWAYVGGGHDNKAGNGPMSGVGQTVGGGEFNKALVDGSCVAGGEQNTASDMHSSIGGGFGNFTSAGSTHQHVGGGQFDTANANFTTIGGGQRNTTNNDWATVGGGWTNVAGGGPGFLTSQTVGGGDHNTAIGDGSTIAGGEDNTAGAMHDAIGGGRDNATIATGVGPLSTHNVISGGLSNRANGMFSSIPGGYQAQTRDYGQTAHASGEFAVTGDAQTSVFVLRNQTPAGPAVPRSLYLDGATQLITVPTNGAMTFHALIVGKDAGTCANITGFEISGTISECGGTTIIAGANITNVFNNPFGVAATVAGNATSNLDIQVTVPAGAPVIDWVASVSTVETVF